MAGESVAEMLAREAERAERLEAERAGPYVRSRRAPKDPSEVVVPPDPSRPARGGAEASGREQHDPGRPSARLGFWSDWTTKYARRQPGISRPPSARRSWIYCGRFNKP